MTGDEPQGTMGRVQTAVSFPPSFARTSRETSGYEAGKELYHLLALAAKQKRGYFLHQKKTA